MMRFFMNHFFRIFLFLMLAGFSSGCFSSSERSLEEPSLESLSLSRQEASRQKENESAFSATNWSKFFNKVGATSLYSVEKGSKYFTTVVTFIQNLFKNTDAWSKLENVDRLQIVEPSSFDLSSGYNIFRFFKTKTEMYDCIADDDLKWISGIDESDDCDRYCSFLSSFNKNEADLKKMVPSYSVENGYWFVLPAFEKIESEQKNINFIFLEKKPDQIRTSWEDQRKIEEEERKKNLEGLLGRARWSIAGENLVESMRRFGYQNMESLKTAILNRYQDRSDDFSRLNFHELCKKLASNDEIAPELEVRFLKHYPGQMYNDFQSNEAFSSMSLGLMNLGMPSIGRQDKFAQWSWGDHFFLRISKKSLDNMPDAPILDARCEEILFYFQLKPALHGKI